MAAMQKHADTVLPGCNVKLVQVYTTSSSLSQKLT